LFTACALAGAPAATGQETPEQPIYQVEVDSVVVRGTARYSEESVRRIARLQVGQLVNGPDVQAAIQRLFATGEFSDVRISVTPAERAIFYIDVEERPIIGRYVFEGLEHVDDGTVTDSAGLVAGSALDPSRIARATVLIRSMLADRGFPQPEVDTTLVRDP